jgi:hypothetical protein
MSMRCGQHCVSGRGHKPLLLAALVIISQVQYTVQIVSWLPHRCMADLKYTTIALCHPRSVRLTRSSSVYLRHSISGVGGAGGWSRRAECNFRTWMHLDGRTKPTMQLVIKTIQERQLLCLGVQPACALHETGSIQSRPPALCMLHAAALHPRLFYLI